MKNKKTIFIIALIFNACILFGQQNTLNNFYTPKLKSNNANQSKAITMPALPKGKEIWADTIKDLHFMFKNKNEFNTEEDPKVEEIKRWKNKLRKEGKDSVLHLNNLVPPENTYHISARTAAAPAIYLNHNFPSTDDPAYLPNDNSIAISNSGMIISTTNSNITIQDTSGAVYLSNSLNAFWGISTTKGFLYDAKVIYDDVLDRFFFVSLIGNTPSASTLMIGYPTTSNPLGSWAYYYYDATSLFSGVWMDYPSIGINDSSLYVTVNTYNSSDAFQYPVIFRFPKAGILSGGFSWTYQYISNPLDNASNNGFTICPIVFGQSGLYGHDMYFVSTVPSGNNYIQFWYWDVTTATVIGQKVASPTYQIGSDAPQSGTTDLLDVGNCRVKDAIVLYNPTTTDWNVYFAFTSISSLSATANYIMKAKLVVNTSTTIPTGSWSLYGNTSGDFCYPSIASFGINPSDENILMSYDASFPTSYPYYEVVSSDVLNNWSTDLPIRTGDNYLSEWDGSKYRWGDYTHLARKQNTVSSPIVWVSGEYGKSDNSGGTWIGEIAKSKFPLNVNNTVRKSVSKLYPNPASNNFTIEFNTDSEGWCTIQLVSIDGKYSQGLLKQNIPDGEHKISLSTADMNSGDYIISILLEGRLIKSEKLSVIK